jgi:hypothetical protein
MQWEWDGVSSSQKHVLKDFPYGDDWRSGWRFDIEHDINSDGGKDFAASLPKEWTRRHILKLTVLEVTRDIYASEVEPRWRDRIHHQTWTLDKLSEALYHDNNIAVIHTAGDLFVRAELIQLKRATDSKADEDDWIYDSRNWVYSKPLWFGKFRGDGWRGRGNDRDLTTPDLYWNQPSMTLFKRMGMSMMHLVADPEPVSGDVQSFRGIVPGVTSSDVGHEGDPGRGVRVRSWKDHFRGWPFSDDPAVNRAAPYKVYPEGQYGLNLEKTLRDRSSSPRDVLHPDMEDTEYRDSPSPTPVLDKLENLDARKDKVTEANYDKWTYWQIENRLVRSDPRLNGVWTPPVGIDLNGLGLNRDQSLDGDENVYAKAEFDYERYRTPESKFINDQFMDPSVTYGGQETPTTPAGITTGEAPSYGIPAELIIGSFNGSAYYWRLLNGGYHKVAQWGPTQDPYWRHNSFGQYAYEDQWVEYYAMRLNNRLSPSTGVSSTNHDIIGYSGRYTDMLYNRLSLLRPDTRTASTITLISSVDGIEVVTSRPAIEESLTKTPVWGLYAIRAWDYQKSKMGTDTNDDKYVYDFQDYSSNQSGTDEEDSNVGEARKRLLMVVQGLQLTHQPSRQTVDKEGNFSAPSERRYIEPKTDDASLYLRSPKGYSRHDGSLLRDYRTYDKQRERILGLHFWGKDQSKSGTGNVADGMNPNRHEIDEVWIGEGFSPYEVLEILGLDPNQFNHKTTEGIRKITEVYSID